jgi:hypothetical protein
MKRKSVKRLLFFEIAVLLLAGLNIAMGGIIFRHDGDELFAAYSPYIGSPSNQTYDSGWLTLYVSFKGLILGNVWFSMNYSLDGKENETVPLKSHYYGSFIQGHPEDNYWDASVELPILSNGSHYLTVYLEGIWETGSSFGTINHTSIDNQTVYFTVISPIQLLTKNQTYNSTEISLNFHINDRVSQITYNLDNHANVTISGNTTLTGLTEGSHNISIYAPDAKGHWVNFDTATFTIIKPASDANSSVTPLLLTALIAIVAVASISLVYFKRRKGHP